jgi:hypothetical protein
MIQVFTNKYVSSNFPSPVLDASNQNSCSTPKSHDSSVGTAHWATDWMIMVLGFNSLWGLGIFLFTTVSRMALGPAHPASYPMGTKGSFPGNKAAGHEADHSPPSSAEVKECMELYLHSSNIPSWHGAQLKHRDNFISTLAVPLCLHTVM